MTGHLEPELIDELIGHLDISMEMDDRHAAMALRGHWPKLRDELELRRKEASQYEAVERDAARYRWLAGNIEMLPYPDQWAGKEWLDGEIDKRRNAPEGKE